MARDTPPSLQAYIGEVAYTTSTANRALPSATWQAGDVIVIVAGDEGGTGNEVVSCSGSQFGLTLAGTTVTAGAGPNHASGGVWTAVAGAGSSGAIVLSDSAAGVRNWGASGFQFRNTDGVGQKFITSAPSSTRTINVTPTDTHSAFVWAVYDWNTNAYTGGTFAPAPVTDSRRFGLAGGGGGYTISVADITDRASAAQAGFGLGTAAPSAGLFTIVGAEILGTTAGAAVIPEVVMAPMANF